MSVHHVQGVYLFSFYSTFIYVTKCSALSCFFSKHNVDGFQAAYLLSCYNNMAGILMDLLLNFFNQNTLLKLLHIFIDWGLNILAHMCGVYMFPLEKAPCSL